ncbi:MAG: cell wall-binding repeat-containing protein [Dermatophilus congolensis]|nr:cell wall-binding repeat-containing protein [Dermatophilus congolensis]
MSAQLHRRHRARRNLALALALTFGAGGSATIPAHASPAEPTPAAPERAVADLTRLDGIDTDGTAFSLTTTEVDGAPVVSGTSPDGTDLHDPAPSAAAPTGARDAATLTHAYASDYAALVDQAAVGSIPRLGAASVYDTAIAVSQRAFAPGQAAAVYITRADRVGDALAAGTLRDGPVLFVPRTGTAPSNVVAEVRRLGVSTVIALGGEAAVSSSVLASAASGRPTSRLAGANSYETAAAIARRAWPKGAPHVYLAGLRQGPNGVVLDSPDAAAGGTLTKGPVLPVPSRGAVPQVVTDTIARLAPSDVYALGGTGVVPTSTLTSASAGRSAGRLTGRNRYETSAAIARHAFPGGADVAYLVAATSLPEAVAGGSLRDGPILFTPPAGLADRAPAGAVSGVLTRLGVTSVGALSPATTLPASAADAVLASAPTVKAGPLPEHPAPSGSPASTEAPTPTPAPTPEPTSSPLTQTQTCEGLVTSFRPIELPRPYTIGCVDSIQGDSRILGLTSTRVYLDDESVASGSIQIVRSLSTSMLKSTIAHELAHAFSYGALNRTQRMWFVAQLRAVDPTVTSPDFNDQSSYEHMPAEQWARGQSACVGYPDPYDRPTASCALVNATIASPR